jgi:hypothetical protein
MLACAMYKVEGEHALTPSNHGMLYPYNQRTMRARIEPAMSCAELTLSLTIDAGVKDAMMLLASLRACGIALEEAMHATADAVHCGLVTR